MPRFGIDEARMQGVAIDDGVKEVAAHLIARQESLNCPVREQAA